MLTIGEIKAQAAVFVSPLCETHFYVCGRDDLHFVAFNERYGNSPYSSEAQFKRATALHFDDSTERFFMVYVADCFDPPIAIVRAEDESEALEIFVDELEWAHIDETDLRDFLKPEAERVEGESEYVEWVSWNSSGKPYDTEQIEIRQIRLHTVENS